MSVENKQENIKQFGGLNSHANMFADRTDR
jgi:hypothetical protein